VTTQTVQSARPVVMPQVNLMPPEIAQAQRLHQLQRGMVGAVVLSALLVGGLYYHAKQGMTSAQNSLQTAQTQNASLEGKYHALDYVQSDYTQAQAKQQMLSQAMGQEIRWSFVLQDLTTRIPNNVWLAGMTVAETSVPGSTAPAATPAVGSTVVPIGNVTFSGIAFNHDDVANWLSSVAKIKGFSDLAFSNSSKTVIGTKTVVSFGSTANVDPQALSNRYTSKAGS
jgi:Tfp pilus assembly protein PilN